MTVRHAGSTDLLSPEDRALLNDCQPTSTVIRKGGVGKTYSAIMLAVMYAQAGLYVWYLELDSQDTGGLHLGLRDAARTYNKGDGGHALAAALTAGAPLPLIEQVRTYESGGEVAVVPTGAALDAALTALSIMGYVQQAPYQGKLAQVLVDAIRARQAAGQRIPDVIVIDADPKIREARELAYAATRYIYSPIDADPASYIDGIEAIRQEMPEARRLNPWVRFIGCLPYKIPLQTIRADLRAIERVKSGQATSTTNHLSTMREEINKLLQDEAFEIEHQYGLPVVFQSAIRESTLAAARTRSSGSTLLEVEATRVELAAERDAGPSPLDLIRRQQAGEDVATELRALRERANALRALPGSAENILADFRPFFVEFLELIARVEQAERGEQ